MSTYTKGESVRITGVTQDADLNIVDPAALTFAYLPPVTRVVTTLVYGVDAAVHRSAVGTFYVDVIGAEVGTYNYRWTSTGPAGITENSFVVKGSAVIPE